jgi:hypothetical protein
MLKRLSVLGLVLAALLTITSGAWAYHTILWLTPDGHRIQTTVTAATLAIHRFDVPPAGYQPGNVPPSVIRSRRARAFKIISRLYTGHLLRFWQKTYRVMISQRNYRFTRSPGYAGWYTASVTRDSLSFHGGTADASVIQSFRTTTGQETDSKITYHLVHLPQGWRIDRWDVSCLSGCP